MRSRTIFKPRNASGALGKAPNRCALFSTRICWSRAPSRPDCLGAWSDDALRRQASLAESCGELRPREHTEQLGQQHLARAKLELAGLGAIDDLRRIAVVVSPADTPRVVSTDPDDDHVIAAAVTGQADLIASGDKRDLSISCR